MTNSELMKPAALAARWGSTYGHLANLRSAGTGPRYIKIGSRVMYRHGDVLAYEEAAIVETATAAVLAGAPC